MEVIAFNREETFAFEQMARVVSRKEEEIRRKRSTHTDTRPFLKSALLDVSFVTTMCTVYRNALQV